MCVCVHECRGCVCVCMIVGVVCVCMFVCLCAVHRATVVCHGIDLLIYFRQCGQICPIRHREQTFFLFALHSDPIITIFLCLSLQELSRLAKEDILLINLLK